MLARQYLKNSGFPLIPIVIFLAIALPGGSTAAFQESAIKPSAAISDDSQSRIRELIDLLSSRQFSERQFASEQLWKMGKAIVPTLEAELKSADPEVAKRINTMLRAIEMGIDFSTPKSTALMVMFFKDGDSAVREQVIRFLEIQQNYKLILDLLAEVEDPKVRRRLYDEEIELGRVVFQLVLADKREMIDQILQHPVSWDFEPSLCIYNSILTKTFDAKVDKLYAEIAEHERKYPLKEIAKNVDQQLPEDPKQDVREIKPPTPTDVERKSLTQYQNNLLLLAKILRIGNRRDEAFELVGKIEDDAQQATLITGIQMELGKWNSVKESLVEESEKAPNDGKVSAKLTQIGMAQYFAGDQASFEKTLNQLVESTETPKLKPAKSPYREIVNLLVASKKWDLLQTYLPKMEKQQALELLWILQRNTDWLTSAGLSDDIEQRIIWFDRVNNQIASLFRQHARIIDKKNLQRKISDRVGIKLLEGDAVAHKSNNVFTMAVTTASRLGSLGLLDESLFHLRSLADLVTPKSPNSREKRQLVLRAMVELEAVEEAWQLIEDRFQEAELTAAFRIMFRTQSTTFDYWNSKLLKSIPSTIERAKLISQIINSPFQIRAEGQAELNLNDYLAQIDSYLLNNSANTRGLTNYHLGMTYFYRGDFEQSKKYLQAANQDNYYSARTRLADLALANQNFEVAFELFEKTWQRSISSTNTTYACSAAAYCLDQLGRSEDARLCKLAAFCSWSQTYRPEIVISQFQLKRNMHWLETIMNVTVHAGAKKALTNEFHRATLAEAQGDRFPELAANNMRIALYNRFRSSNSGTAASMVDEVWNVDLRQALNEIQNGSPEKAYARMMEFNQLRPGEASIGEKLIPMFDKEHPEIGDQLFAKVADYYRETISKFPESPLHQNNYAWFCASSKRRVEFAIQHSQMSLELRPNNSSYLDTMAELKYLDGETDEALQLSKRCMQINSNSQHYLQQFIRFGGKF